MNQPPGYPPGGGPPYPGQPGSFDRPGPAPQQQPPPAAPGPKPYQGGTQLMPTAPQPPPASMPQQPGYPPAPQGAAGYGAPPPQYAPQPYGQPPGYPPPAQPPPAWGQPAPGYAPPGGPQAQAPYGAPPFGYGAPPPYAGQGAAPPGYGPSAFVAAIPGGPFGIGDMLSAGWERFKANWLMLIVAYLINLVIIAAIAGVFFLPAAFLMDGDSGALVGSMLMGAGGLLAAAAALFLMGGLTKFALACARGEQPGLGLVFGGASFVLPIFVAALLMVLPMLVPIVNIFVAICLCLTMFFIVDKNMGGVDAMKASWNATNGYRLTTFVTILVVYVAAFIPIIGSFIVGPLMLMCLASLYLRVTQGGASSAAAPGQPWGSAPVG